MTWQTYGPSFLVVAFFLGLICGILMAINGVYRDGYSKGWDDRYDNIVRNEGKYDDKPPIWNILAFREWRQRRKARREVKRWAGK